MIAVDLRQEECTIIMKDYVDKGILNFVGLGGSVVHRLLKRTDLKEEGNLGV